MIGFIPARGGSKGIRRKNLQRYQGVPLVAHAIRTALTVCHKVVVSTDDEETSSIARLVGASVETRPAELATDSATVDQVAEDFWRRNPDGFLLIQPTVPQVTSEHLLEMIQWWDHRSIAHLAVEEPHLFWQNGTALTERAQRQDRADWPAREVGVRLYPPAFTEKRKPYVVSGPIFDIDTPADLNAVRSGPSRRILFRCVYGDEVGSGHYRRCLAIASELSQHEIHFAVLGDGSPPSMPPLPYPLGTLDLPHDYDLIVNDTLDTEPTWDTKTLWLENMLPVPGVVVNALYKPPLDTTMYWANRDQSETTAYYGPEWADIRPEFTVVPPYEPSGEGRVLLTFGGTDPAGMTDRLWDALEDSDAELRIMGRSHQDFPSMGEAMAWADLVVTSGGRTVYEALACNRPVFAVPVNEREHSHEALNRYGTLYWSMEKSGPVENLAPMVWALAQDTEQLGRMSDEGVHVVDGRGTERIAALIEGMLL